MRTYILTTATILCLPLSQVVLAQTEGFEATCTVTQGVPGGSIVEKVYAFKEALVKTPGRYDSLGNMGRGAQTYNYEKGLKRVLISKRAFIAGLRDTPEGEKWEGMLYPAGMYEYNDTKGAPHRIEQFSTTSLGGSSPSTERRTIVPLTPSEPSIGVVTISQAISVARQDNSTVTLPAGTRLELLSQDGSDVNIRYEGRGYVIPISATNLNHSGEPITQEAPRTPTTSGDIQVSQATYGVDGRQVDITETIKALVAAGKPIKVSNTLAGSDPAFGTVKTLTVVYTENGQQKTATAKEGETLVYSKP